MYEFDGIVLDDRNLAEWTAQGKSSLGNRWDLTRELTPEEVAEYVYGEDKTKSFDNMSKEEKQDTLLDLTEPMQTRGGTTCNYIGEDKVIGQNGYCILITLAI